jgi:hypothetical protein
MTIRRDLNSDSAPVVLLGGYIVLEPRSASHYLISDQKTRLVKKSKAARLAASLVQPHRRCSLTAEPNPVDHRGDRQQFAVYRCLLLAEHLPGAAGKTRVSGDPLWR